MARFIADVDRERSSLFVNGSSSFPKTGRLKFPSLAVSVVNRFSDLQLRSLEDGRVALAAAAV